MLDGGGTGPAARDAHCALVLVNGGVWGQGVAAGVAVRCLGGVVNLGVRDC